MNIFRTSAAKVTLGFVLGASAVGGIATAAGTFSGSTSVVCADNRTGALYAASSAGTCTTSRTAIPFAGGGSISPIVKKVSPSVVTVNVDLGNGNGDTGSGSIIKSDSATSYILTNNHVIDAAAGGSGTIKVELDGGEQIPATIVGRDMNYDLAVLKVSRGNLPVIAIGDSSQISVGDQVIAFGSPLGLNGTVTAGIVSALNRPVTTQGSSSSTTSYVDAIQTDAAINPGNSGGALTDSAGRIVGINSAIASTSTSLSGSQSGNIGLGFAIPINEAERVYNEIINSPSHTSTRPVLGVYFDNNYTGVGARVANLVTGEAADKAGIPSGAIVTNIDGVKIPDEVTAIVRIRSYAPGAVIKVTATLPSGGSKTFTVTLGSANS